MEHQKLVLPKMPSLEHTLCYPIKIACLPYPEGYVTPKFFKFNGHNGSAREQVARFTETLGAFCANKNLRLRDFSKSLTMRAYTWYAILTLATVSSWEEIMSQFYAKKIRWKNV